MQFCQDQLSVRVFAQSSERCLTFDRVHDVLSSGQTGEWCKHFEVLRLQSRVLAVR